MGTEKRERQKAGRQARLEAAAAAQKRAEKRRRYFFIGGVALLMLVAFAISFWRSRGNDSTTNASTTPGSTAPPPTTGKPTTCPPADGSAAPQTTFSQPPPMCIDPAKAYTAVVATDKGNFTIALDTKSAPLTVNNFVVLSRYHYYDNVPFHRVVKDFVIQTGDPNGARSGQAGSGGPGYTITDENPPDTSVYTPGAVAMANTGKPNSGGSQWFVFTGPNPLPGPTYPKFGQVTEGLDTTVAAISATAPPAGDSAGKPTDPTLVKTITINES